MNECEQLLKDIQARRMLLIEVAEREGLQNQETLKCSEELDRLIYLFFQSKKQY